MIQASAQLTANCFVKRIDLSDGGLAFRIELEKAKQMVEVFSSDPDLSTPRLLESDAAAGVLIFERMPAVRPFTSRVPTHWFERVGRALARAHTGLALPGELDLVREQDAGRCGTVTLHGDFMPNNMARSADQLIVFDWGLRPWNLEVYTRGTPAIDIAGFIGPWMLPRWWDLGLPGAKLVAMISTYLEEVGHDSLTADLLRETLSAELDAQVHYRRNLIEERSVIKRGWARLKLRWNRTRVASGIESQIATR